MQERTKPPATLGSPLERLRAQRAAASTVANGVRHLSEGEAASIREQAHAATRALVVSDHEAFKLAMRGATHIEFDDTQVALQFAALLKSEPAGALELGSREYGAGRARFLLSADDADASPPAFERKGCQAPQRDKATFEQERQALLENGCREALG
jgi:hypothetical protein